jgi:hypothetical protein
LEKSKQSRPFVLLILICLLTIIGVGGLVSGAMLFSSPTGELIGLNAEILKGTPFVNFLIPGIILFLCIGIFPVLVSYGLLKKPAWHWTEAVNICKKYRWPWTATWAAGVIMLIWITVETAMLGYISFLQPVIAIWGIAIITFTLLPKIRQYYTVKK